LYIHLLDYPLKNFLLEGYGDKVKYVQFLHDASEIKVGIPHGYGIRKETDGNDINLLLPINKPNVEIPVIELFLKD
jgi:alpha-L-fucosidase